MIIYRWVLGLPCDRKWNGVVGDIRFETTIMLILWSIALI